MVPPEVVDRIVARTEGVSASFTKELMRRAAQFAFGREPAASEATEADIDHALEELLFSGGVLNARLLGMEAAGAGGRTALGAD